jgi:hypothetical protein
MIDKKLMEEYVYSGIGFKPLVVYKSWRVAVLNYIDEIQPENIHKMERHPETDEVFFLIHGSGILFLGEGEPEVKKLYAQKMTPGVIYNVKPFTWHTVVLSQDASVLIVENADTNESNSEYCELNNEQREFIQNTAKITPALKQR